MVAEQIDQRINDLRTRAAQELARRRSRRRDGAIDKARMARVCEEFMVPVPTSTQEQDVRQIRSEYQRVRAEALNTWLSAVGARRLLAVADTTAVVCVLEDLKTSQIRRFLDGVKQVSAKMRSRQRADRSAVELLKIPLVYVAARQKEASLFARVCIEAIDRIRGDEDNEAFEKDWDMFERFIEAIVAYHKFYGGED